MIAYLDMRADGSEKVKYDYDGYYAYIRRSTLSLWQNYSADSHWHDDLEFISVISGYMDYNVNGEIIRLNAGQGIIVNSRQLHFGFSKEHKDCDFICVLLHPMLLCVSQYIEREFVSPILSDGSVAYIFLDENTQWQKTVLEILAKMVEYKDSFSAPLLIQSLFNQIWLLIIENAVDMKQRKVTDRNLSVLKDMILYIQKKYRNKITLCDIAKSGNVSKSTCLVIFKKYLHDTPANYLIEYRLKKAAELLKKTNMSVSEISFEVGFHGASYFAEAFKKNYGCTPSEYKNFQGRKLYGDYD